MNLLQTYVDAWHQSATATLDVCAELTAEQWELPTDCPGWTVKDVVAHNAHLEYVQSTGDDVDTTVLKGVVSSDYTEAGVKARRSRTAAEVVEEFRTAVDRRFEALQTLPDDPQSVPEITPGNIGWSWDTLLRNRAVDMWVHEQDIRRAIDKPGDMDSPGAHITANTFAFGMPYVLGKKAKAPVGTTFVWRVHGEVPLEVAAEVGEDGRAHRLDETPSDPTASVSMSTEAFATIAAGRRSAADYGVDVNGDHAVADNVLANMSVTP